MKFYNETHHNVDIAVYIGGAIQWSTRIKAKETVVYSPHDGDKHKYNAHISVWTSWIEANRYHISDLADHGQWIKLHNNSYVTGYDYTFDSKNWMNNLNGEFYLHQLSIPGTHDTCAKGHGGALAETQTLTLDQQLNSGIRFVDIRCRHIEDRFAIHHGPIFEHLMFGTGVRDVCLQYLKAHPSECIVMSIKKEHSSTNNNRSFEDTFNWYLENNKDFWFLENRMPKLEEVRGKIVLLRRFGADKTPLGISADGWKDDETFSMKPNKALTITVQDQYKVPTLFDIKTKWGEVKSLLDKAKKEPADTWFINFTSGTSTGAYPNAVAKGSPGVEGVNSYLSEYMKDAPISMYGVIVMDFPEFPGKSKLISQICSKNYKRTSNWIAHHDMSSDKYQSFFDEYTKKGYVLKQVCGYSLKKEALFAAIWEEGVNEFFAHHGLTSEQYQKYFDQYSKEGYRLVDVSGYGIGDTAYYAAIWNKSSGPTYWAHHGMSAEEYQQAFHEYVSKGFKLVRVNGYSVNGVAYFAAIWQKIEGEFIAHHNMTSEQYQQYFDQYDKEGYRLVDVSGYGIGDKAYYAAIWNKSSGPTYWAHHGMSSEEYQQYFDEYVNQGFRLVRVSAYEISGVLYYAAIWDK